MLRRMHVVLVPQSKLEFGDCNVFAGGFLRGWGCLGWISGALQGRRYCSCLDPMTMCVFIARGLVLLMAMCLGFLI